MLSLEQEKACWLQGKVLSDRKIKAGLTSTIFKILVCFAFYSSFAFPSFVLETKYLYSRKIREEDLRNMKFTCI